VSKCHGWEVRTVDAGWVELSAVGRRGTAVDSVGGIGGTVGLVVTGRPGDAVDICGVLEVVVGVVFSAVGAPVDQEVLSA